MSAPIPRRPGLWRALARDAVLNPEEAAVRAAVIAAHTQPEPPAENPAPPPADAIGGPPRRRLSPYQSLIDRADSWKTSLTHDEDRARLEAFHPDGAAIMATAVRGRTVNIYVLPATQKNTPRWRAIHPSALGVFLLRRQVLGPHIPTCRCTCGKRKYPTETRARAAIVDVTIRRVVKARGLQSERRAYRCPDDDRVWHLTSIKKWYGEKKPKHQKGAPR